MTKKKTHLEYFEWNGISSKQFNLYITNGGGGILLPFVPKFVDQINTPMGQNFTYYMGTGYTQNTFTLNVAAISLTELMMHEMIKWLDVTKVGKLILDSRPDYFTSCKITSISDSIWHPYYDEENDGYLLTFSITFSTIGDYAYQTNTLYSFNADIDYYDKVNLKESDPEYQKLIDVIYDSPIIVYDGVQNKNNFTVETIEGRDYTKTTKTFDMINFSGIDYFEDILTEGISSCEVIYDGKVYYNYDFKEFENYSYNDEKYPPVDNAPKPSWQPLDLTIRGKYGFITNTVSEELIEKSVNTFLNKQIEYDLAHDVNYAKTLDSKMVYNAGALGIKKSDIQTYHPVLNFYSRTDSDRVTRYYFNYIYPFWDKFLSINADNTNKYYKFMKVGDLLPIMLDNGEITINNLVGKQEVTRDMFLAMTDGGENFLKEGILTFAEYRTLTINTSVYGSGENREFEMPLVKPLHGFELDDTEQRDKLYFDHESNKWVVKRKWRNFDLTPSLLLNARLDWLLKDFELTQNSGSPSTSPVYDYDVESLTFNYFHSQEFVNNYIKNYLLGTGQSYIIVSVPLGNIKPLGDTIDDMYVYSNKMQKLNHDDIVSTTKEGFYLLNTPQGLRLVMRLNAGRITSSEEGEASLSNVVSFLATELLSFMYLVDEEYTEVIQPEEYQAMLDYADSRDFIDGETIVVPDIEPSFENPVKYVGIGDDGKFILDLQKSVVILETRVRAL